MKCKNCGEIFDGYKFYCPTCGCTMEEEIGPSAVEELAKKLSKIDEEKSAWLLESKKREDEPEDMSYMFEEKKINLIQAFPIPNTIEGIFEFMILASSNFDANMYAKNINTKDISDAWLVKIEQAYRKADVMFGEHPRFVKIKEMYDKVIKEKDAAVNERKAQRKKWVFFAFVVSGIAAVAIAIWVCVLFSPVAIGKSDEAFLGQYVGSVISYLEEKGFDNFNVSGTVSAPEGYDAGDVISIKINGDDDFDSTDKFKKKSYIEIVYAVKSISVSTGSSDLKDKNYKDVVAVLKEMGFTDISVVEEKDVTVGLFNSVGDVKSVQINGDKKFKAGDEFPSDAKVIVTYHGKK